MISQTRSTGSQENPAQPHLVFTNDDLLTEIFIRLPILCIHLFTSVSKQWLRILTSPDFTLRRSKIPNLDPPAGIFANHLRYLYKCDFLSLDYRLESRKSTMDHRFEYAEVVDHVRILQSCNGLLLCSGSSWPHFYYVYNPSTNLHKRIPQPPYYHFSDDSCFYRSGEFRMAFDPRKSLYYKVVHAGRVSGKTEVQVYSSETGSWRLCSDRFSYSDFNHFDSAIYWNDAFHWLEGSNKELKHFKLNIENDFHPSLTILEVPHGLHRGRNFLESFGGASDDNPLSFLMEIPHILHLEGKFFESSGCLLLVCRDDIGSTVFTIYEMMKASSVWSVRYRVNIENIKNPLPEGWSIRTSVWNIWLGDGEEDAFVVINLSGKVVKYNLISKTYIEIFDSGSNQIDDVQGLVIPPFLVDPNLHDFIPSLASV